MTALRPACPSVKVCELGMGEEDFREELDLREVVLGVLNQYTHPDPRRCERALASVGEVDVGPDSAALGLSRGHQHVEHRGVRDIDLAVRVWPHDDPDGWFVVLWACCHDLDG